MKAADRRDLYRSEMKQRHEESYAGKNDSGRFRDIYEPDKKAGVKFLKLKEDTHEFYIIPYITGGQHPKLKPGKVAFVLEVFIHRGVGVNEDSYICLNRTFRKRCPICEYQAELRESDAADDETLKALNPTKRAIYNVVCCDTVSDEAKGVQIFDVSHWLFTIPLEEFAHKKRGGGEILYADIDDGKVINFQQTGSKRTLKYTAFEFKDRPEITEDQLDGAHCLDELIHIPEYDEVYLAFWEAKETEASPKEDERKPKEEPKKEEVKKEEPKREVKKEEVKKPVEKEPEDVPDPVVASDDDCPYGAAYGADYNAYEECRSCVARKACRAKKDELDEAEAAAKAAAPAEKKKLTRRER